MMRALILAAAIAAPCVAAAADVSGTITILEGQALIYRGSGRLHAVEGVRLAAGDIVETAASTFVQIELADQSVAQFGSATRVMINASASRQKAERWLYIMDGWVKVTGAKRDPPAGPGLDLRAPLFEMPASPSVVVLRSSPAEVNLFVERGDIRVVERQVGGSVGAVPFKSGDFYRRKLPGRGTVNPGSMQAFVGDMPRFFRDSLPLRLDRFRDRPVQAKDAPDFSYADVESWLKAEPAVRRPLMQRWRGKAREPAFRAALVANLSAHPEWDPILFPEKYLPKDPPAPRAAFAVGRAASAAASTAAR
ncbi:MAG TPA: hypothetical protein VGJ65_11390 [Albitalea sp.]|jgi:hypothetical protein